MYMSIEDAISRLKTYTPITEEDKATFEIAINALTFAKDFVGMNAEKMKHAMNLMDSLEYIIRESAMKEIYRDTLKL